MVLETTVRTTLTQIYLPAHRLQPTGTPGLGLQAAFILGICAARALPISPFLQALPSTV